MELVVSVWILTQNPFSKAFLERLGSKSADAVAAAAKWVVQEVVQLVKSSRTVKILVIVTDVAGCQVQFVIRSNKGSVIRSALMALEEATPAAIGLVARLQEFEPQKLVYIFDSETNTWHPTHAATKLAGVISENPVAVDVRKYTALSIGGEYTPTDEDRDQ